MTADDTDAGDPHPPPKSPTGDRPRPILVGYDGSTPSSHALAYAAQQAGQQAQPLLLVHIRQNTASYDIGLGWPEPPQDPTDLVEWLQTELAVTLDARDLPVEIAEGSGNPARRIAELATEHHASTIILGAPEHRLHHHIGSVPAWLARHAQCPVIIVP